MISMEESLEKKRLHYIIKSKGGTKMSTLKEKLDPYLGIFKMEDDMKNDYFIRFHTSEIKNLPIEKLREVGDWSKYSNNALRGWSSHSKEEIQNYVVEHLNLKADDVEVLNANTGLYWIGK